MCLPRDGPDNAGQQSEEDASIDQEEHNGEQDLVPVAIQESADQQKGKQPKYQSG